jgi:hypothetical protein
MSDAEVSKIRSDVLGISERCLTLARFGGIEAIPDEVDQCFEMTAPKRWHGLWLAEFEGSRFCPSPATRCASDTPGPFIWLDTKRLRNSLPPGKMFSDHPYEVLFIGRRTLHAGKYGHLGMSPYEMTVDKLISISPARQPTP